MVTVGGADELSERGYRNLFGGVWGPKRYPVLLGLSVLFYLYSLQWQGGVPATEVEAGPAWAPYVVSFVFFTGASAGAIIVAVLAHGLGARRFAGMARIAQRVAISCLVPAAVLLVLVDRSRLARAPRLFLDARFVSLFLWDLAIVGIYLGTAVVLGYLVTRLSLLHRTTMSAGRRLSPIPALVQSMCSAGSWDRDRRMLRALAAQCIPAAVLLHSVPVAVFGLVRAPHGWYSAMVAPLFIVSVAICALALVILAASRSRALDDVTVRLGRVLFFCLPALGYGLFAELVGIIVASKSGTEHILHEMALGPYASLSWVGLLGGVVVPFFLLRSGTTSGTALAALLVVLGVLLQRWNLLLPPLLGHAHLPYTVGGYAPTWPELSATAGVYVLGLLVYLLLARLAEPVAPGGHP